MTAGPRTTLPGWRAQEGRRLRQSRGGWSSNSVTAMVAAGALVLLAVLVFLLPVPYVAWSPGGTVDVAGRTADGTPMIEVKGLPTEPLHGQLRMTTVSVTRVDARLALPEALAAHWLPRHDVLPRDFYYPPNKSEEQVKAEEVAMMDTSRADAVVAALRAAGQPVLELPQVQGVSLSGASHGKLQPGDLLLKVDSVAVQTLEDVRDRIRRHKVGEQVVFTVERNGKQLTQTVTTQASAKDATVPVVGITTGIGYKYSAEVVYHLDNRIVGPSAGLVFALGIYDLVQPADVLAGRVVAGTGSIGPDGNVGAIGGIQEKIAGAEKAKADIFLVPAANCKDLGGLQTDLQLVKVGTLRDAISALSQLQQDPSGKEVPRC
ncbi:YlbL family protein [Aestuariimicrobium soli]|uniref:YlbL family protein n=1 Tax=Aestuariimicrobium soli TaxID=2035834 RepID=UPI003EC069C5